MKDDSITISPEPPPVHQRVSVEDLWSLLSPELQRAIRHLSEQRQTTDATQTPDPEAQRIADLVRTSDRGKAVEHLIVATAMSDKGVMTREQARHVAAIALRVLNDCLRVGWPSRRAEIAQRAAKARQRVEDAFDEIVAAYCSVGHDVGDIAASVRAFRDDRAGWNYRLGRSATFDRLLYFAHRHELDAEWYRVWGEAAGFRLAGADEVFSSDGPNRPELRYALGDNELTAAILIQLGKGEVRRRFQQARAITTFLADSLRALELADKTKAEKASKGAPRSALYEGILPVMADLVEAGHLPETAASDIAAVVCRVWMPGEKHLPLSPEVFAALWNPRTTPRARRRPGAEPDELLTPSTEHDEVVIKISARLVTRYYARKRAKDAQPRKPKAQKQPPRERQRVRRRRGSKRVT